MDARYGNLDMSKKYTLKDIEYGSLKDGNGEYCQNCGQFITNVAIVESEDRELFRIGLDCMETIVNMLPSEKLEAKKRVRRVQNFIRRLKKEIKTVIYNESRDYAFGFTEENIKEWNSFWRVQFKWSKYKNIVKKLGIKTIKEVER